MIYAILRRFGQMLFVMFGISVIVFLIFNVIPNSDPAQRMAGKNATPELVASITEEWGFNDPLPKQYLTMMEKIFTSDLISYESQPNVDEQIVKGIPATFSLCIGAAVIWKFVYDFRSEGSEQIGILNAIVVAFGGTPEAWMTIPFWNNFFLMVILIWIQTGFAMVILSAALRGIPEETIEAAVIDGANGFQIFFKIMVPQIWGTIAVVWTTITILVLKVFDIVLAMTNGQWQSQVLANLMFDWMFRGGGDFGRGAAIAVVIMILVIPIMVWNIRNAAKEMKGH